ncbi:NUDIX hydrolase domain-like protein [Mrakia frigida]|uniref:NAD(+) diphosphatase n=1 Tax=Mrakia frigida TaxID=29902 RepID=UPI003FCBF979
MRVSPLNLHNNITKAIYMGENFANFYSGSPPLNRLSFHRHSTALLTQHLLHPLALFTAFHSGQPLVSSSTKRISFLPLSLVLPLLGPAPHFRDDSNHTIKHLQGARAVGAVPLVFLGIDEKDVDESEKTLLVKDPHPDLNQSSPTVWAIDATNLGEKELAILTGGAGEEAREFADGRASSASWGAWEAGVFAVGRSLVDWNSRNTFCAGCGSKVYSLWGGWKLSCSTALDESSSCPSQKGLHNYAYPRTDPVLIMGIISEDGESILMGRQKAWPRGMYSCLAGFAEPGESFEDAVRREVYEEAGIVVKEVMYHSSQPWPYPANLMVGCFGRADSSQTIRLDLDNELEDARWFTRTELLAILADPKGTVINRHEQAYFNPGAKPNDGPAPAIPFRLPPRTAIAGVLASDWAKETVQAFAGKGKEALKGRM